MQKELQRAVFVLTLAAGLILYGFSTSLVFAQECAVRVEAPAIVDPAISTTFNVSIIAENVPSPGFYGWEVNVTWTPGKINCTAEYINTNLWGGYFLGPWITDPIDNVAGVYHQSLTGRYPGTPETGTRWLVNLTFTIVETDGYLVTINISPWAPAAYCLADKNAQQIPHSFIPATLNVIPEFYTLSLLPFFIVLSLASLLIGKTFKKNPP